MSRTGERSHWTERTHVRTVGGMGWNNPPVPWSEFERRLSGRAPSPSASRSGYQNRASRPGIRAQNDVKPAYAELHCHSNFSFLDGASHPEELVEEAARLGPRGPGPHRPRRLLRRRPLRRGGGRAGRAHRLRRRAHPRPAPPVPGRGRPTPTGRHLVVLARDPEGYARLCRAISDAHMAAGEKGLPKTDLADAGRPRHGGHWQVLTGCRKGTVPGRPGRPRARPPPPGSWPAWSTPSGATTWPWSCGTTATRSTRPATTPWRRWPRGPGSTWWPPTTSTTPRPPGARWPPPWPRCGPAASLDELDGLAAGRRPPPACARAPSRPAASPATRAWSSGRPSSAASAPSTCTWSPPTCPTTRCPPATTR